MVGHTTLLRYAGFSYVGAEAAAEFPDRSRRNGFFESVGALPAVDPEGARRLEDLGPEKALAWLREAAGRQAAAG
jgi:hypothetical protein